MTQNLWRPQLLVTGADFLPTARNFPEACPSPQPELWSSRMWKPSHCPVCAPGPSAGNTSPDTDHLPDVRHVTWRAVTSTLQPSNVYSSLFILLLTRFWATKTNNSYSKESISSNIYILQLLTCFQPRFSDRPQVIKRRSDRSLFSQCLGRVGWLWWANIIKMYPCAMTSDCQHWCQWTLSK